MGLSRSKPHHQRQQVEYLPAVVDSTGNIPCRICFAHIRPEFLAEHDLGTCARHVGRSWGLLRIQLDSAVDSQTTNY